MNILDDEETNVPPASQAEQTIFYSSGAGAPAQCEDSDEKLSHTLQCSNLRRSLHCCRGDSTDVEEQQKPELSHPTRRARTES